MADIDVRSRVLWWSTALFVVTGLVEVLLHELGHAISALALGGHPVTLFPGAVIPGGLPDSKMVIVATAGPVFSLVLGAVGALAVRAWSAPSIRRLAAIWFTFHCFIGSLGYLILTPFGANDLGGIAWYFDLPPIVRWGMFGLGIFFMTKVSALLVPALAEFAPSQSALATPATRSSYLVAAAIVPWLVQVVVQVVGELPPQSVFSFAPTLGMGIPLISGAFDIRKRGDLTAKGHTWPAAVPWPWLVAGAAIVAVNAFVLRTGLDL